MEYIEYNRKEYIDEYNHSVSNNERYYIKMINYIHKKTIEKYRKYKCSDGWSENKKECWKFTKQGALKKIELLKREYHINYDKGLILFELIKAE